MVAGAIPGDVVECGVYRGGTAAVLARVATHSRLPPILEYECPRLPRRWRLPIRVKISGIHSNALVCRIVANHSFLSAHAARRLTPEPCLAKLVKLLETQPLAPVDAVIPKKK